MKENQIITEILSKLIEGNDLLSLSLTLYNKLKEVLPMQRLGIGVISDDGHFFVSKINISDSTLHLKEGFRAPTHKSSLIKILRTDQPRILNDLKEYLRLKPGSVSTRLMIKEGMNSSLTVPLLANGKPIGLVFFSSKLRNVFTKEHGEFVKQFSHVLSITLEKALLLEKLEQTEMSLELALAQNEGLTEELQQLNSPARSSSVTSNHDDYGTLTFEEWQRKIIVNTLAKTKGRIYGSRGAAKLLDLPPTTLQSKMKKLGISKNTDI